jgi:hypothetical protein
MRILRLLAIFLSVSSYAGISIFKVDRDGMYRFAAVHGLRVPGSLDGAPARVMMYFPSEWKLAPVEKK